MAYNRDHYERAVMPKIHFVNNGHMPDSPFCANRVDMYMSQNFKTTEVKEDVTCKLCLMRLGIIPETRGNWDNRTK